MKETKRQRILGLFGVLLLFGLLFFGFSGEAPSQAQSGPGTAQGGGDEEGEDKAQTPKGQTFYKWTDDKGNLYFTDDLAKVPNRFRDQIETLDLPPLREETQTRTAGEAPQEEEPPPPSSPILSEVDREPEKQDQASREPYIYKEIPFHQFMHIQVGMDEAEVISRLGFPSLVTPNDYFYGDRGRYRYRIIRLIYLGNRNLNEKTTVIEIGDGRVVNTERIFPF